MIAALTQLLIFQLIGEVIARGLDLPIPGPVIGMALLFAALSLRGAPGESLQTTSQTLLSHLSLLFVPAGVGIIVHLSRVADEWPALLAALIVSTFVSMAVTALVMKALARRPAANSGSAS
ncbi:MAG: CidA/LrgA family protein [Rhodocyclaceae bacterium]|nr:MAG: CidA/LrgA family protein [Rhodocyclaceae bacterium]